MEDGNWTSVPPVCESKYYMKLCQPVTDQKFYFYQNQLQRYLNILTLQSTTANKYLHDGNNIT